MKKLIFVVLLVALLLSFSLSIVVAGMDMDDPHPPGDEHNGDHGNTDDVCVTIPSHAANNGDFNGKGCK